VSNVYGSAWRRNEDYLPPRDAGDGDGEEVDVPAEQWL
jgi:hypothetical protein